MHGGKNKPAMPPNPYVSPDRGWGGRLQNFLANWRGLRRLRRSIINRLPFMVLASDVRDILYANWIVPTGHVAALIPEGLRPIERDGHTILTLLTYRHGHFGPALLGPLRRLFPSPLQSNWRLYLQPDNDISVGTVLFVSNIFDSTLYAVGTRLFSDVLPSHRAAWFRHDSDGILYRTSIQGAGSAPTAHIEATISTDRILPGAFSPFFADWKGAVATLALQHRAIAHVTDEDALASSDIHLPIEIDSAKPLRTTAYMPGPWLRELGADSPPFCFAVPAVPFRVLSENVRYGRH